MALLVAPAVEVEVERSEGAVIVDDEVGADVAHPDVIQVAFDELAVVAGAVPLGQFAFAGPAEDSHRLVAGDGLGDAAQGGLHVGGEVFPDGLLGTKGNERALLRFAFVRHEPAPGLLGTGQAQRQAKAGTQACDQ